MENNLKEEFFKNVKEFYSKDGINVIVTNDMIELSEKFEKKFNKNLQDFTLPETKEMIQDYYNNTDSIDKKEKFSTIVKSFFKYYKERDIK